MARVIYCRFCDEPTEVLASDFPLSCPACHRLAKWTTMAPVSHVPSVAWTLNGNDKRLLKGMRIDPNG